MPSRAALPLDRTAEHQECIWVTTALAKFTSEPQLGSTRQEQIRSMAGQDQGWPGSRPWLIRIVAGRDQGWSGPWLIRIMAGRDSGWAGSRQEVWSGSWPAKIKTKLGRRLDPSCPNKNASGICSSRIRPGPDPVRRAIGLDQIHRGRIGHAGLNSGPHGFF